MNPFVTISPKADEELDGILTYLEANFSVTAAANCLDVIEKICWDVAAFPFAFPAYKRKSVRKAVVNKHLSMYYQVRKDTIEVLSFWDNRRDVESLDL
ncbi:MAG: type II toxin-antitoxin system RelE/ParE family toxin [Saprospiraceae bacterium]|nr:type II toxin-antitoxin system RelE/ParE family toxin [Saprospiraceae bacterium]MCF8248335.1 type II toxin-antitoxin system RelE/ParE family toxin [Saprospiraceae bacterium]MCF8280226.1 type II toxin-antitoxin system RelE/ParE family toxin [Bacteroidales bacterium]MCF8309863.1 type II toxin-antitoxin system RelE/ParE family toxin [Saprospiraceae bacterium]MCF8438806.1 type II toxin-antitoxin system RelE/ParE family toxin [Saprospiraceae bacterium]